MTDKQFLRLTPFGCEKKQTYFEFGYLSVLFVITILLLFSIYCNWIKLPSHFNKHFAYSAIGAFLGGWCFDVKWFYRAVAYSKEIKRYNIDKTDKNSEEKGGIFKWEFNRFYWRLLTPFASLVVGFGTFCIVTSGLIPFIEVNCTSGKSAFGFSFIFGYFSDLAIGKMADWGNQLLKKQKGNEKDN
ncbi:hypothetical protein DMA11_10555 [Marinilabiliaceae bacterium JC017]|nr:hypothetical protein DMA11_10555 [Marinilabiliaceae bacterium JC017]